MALFKTSPADYTTIDVGGKKVRALKTEVLNTFNVDLLGLGDLAGRSSSTDAIAAVFDLQGFTNFCKQIDPNLSVPVFLKKFLDWMFASLKDETVKTNDGQGAFLYHPLPFFMKYLGDGLLVLWDAATMTDLTRRNLVLSMQNICVSYADFVRKLNTQLVEPPPKLRCGIARGTVFSVGDGQDFVGSCINMAARLQKLPGVSFAFNRRGFVVEGDGINPFFSKEMVIRAVSIRGIGDHELVGIRKDELDAMSEEERAQFKKP